MIIFFIIKPVYILWVTEWVPSYLSCVLCKKYYYYFFFLNIASGDSERGLEILFVVAFMVCDEVNFQWLSVNFIDHVRRATIEKFAAVCDKAFSHVLLTAMINMREWQSRSSHECDESAIGFSVCRHEKSVFEEPVLSSPARINVITWKLLENIKNVSFITKIFFYNGRYI